MKYEGLSLKYWVQNGHPSFAEGRYTSAAPFFMEMEAMREDGLTDAEWYGMSREQRALRVGHMSGRNLITQMRLYDIKKENERR